MMPTSKELLGAFHHVMDQRGLSNATRRAYARWAGRFLAHLGAVPLEKAGIEAVQRYLAFERERGLSRASRRLAVSALRLFLGEVAGVSIPTPDALGFHKEKADRAIALTPHQVDAVLARMRGGHGLIARLMVRCGIRVSECCRLRTGEVDAVRGILVVRGVDPNKSRKLEVPRDLMRPVREQKERVQRLWMRDWQDAWATEDGEPKVPATAWLFPAKTRRWSRTGPMGKEDRHHLNPNSVLLAVRMAMDAAEVKRTRPCSALRATFATRSLARGVSEWEVARAMGLRRTDSISLTISS